MKFLLDTCIVSDFIKGDKQTSTSQIAISRVSLMEIQYSLQLNQERGKTLKKVIDDFIHCISILPFTEGDADKAAKARAYLCRLVKTIGGYGILIAGAVLNNRLILVTSKFKRICTLTLSKN
ncbi:PIN domain-containing protein [Coxiella endosymbiont of Ornithodoros maritimus]|uniref:hypothetical protein n=1 Tax=Coxiella endosymbiont of Ornithodoros maritimus TaxID=1656172 RepID=UPI00226535C9|nr:hypothetical protein [Coxiella endosymbiont of Ornithodoros maritimus]